MQDLLQRKLGNPPDPLVQLQLDCLRVSDETVPLSEKLELLQTMKPLAAGLDFQEDIQYLIEVCRQDTQFSQLQLVDSDDPCDLLLSGTEVLGSCQGIFEDPNFSKGLLDLLMNGGNRVVAVKDARGTIVARRIFRILYDNALKIPVLFVERAYTKGSVSQAVLKGLDDFVKQRAQDLGLPLLTTDEGERLYEGGTVVALGGPAPFGYSDGAGRCITYQGKFPIGEARVIVDPKN